MGERNGRLGGLGVWGREKVVWVRFRYYYYLVYEVDYGGARRMDGRNTEIRRHHGGRNTVEYGIPGQNTGNTRNIPG